MSTLLLVYAHLIALQYGTFITASLRECYLTNGFAILPIYYTNTNNIRLYYNGF